MAEKTIAARVRRLTDFETRRVERAQRDIDRRDRMIREDLAAGVPASDIAIAVNVSRTYVYRIRDGHRSGSWTAEEATRE